jgi:hypothetical protein
VERPVEPVPAAEAVPAPAALLAGAPTEITDPRVITILSTEHWSLLTARTLAYNEAFTRGGMFLAFLSTSFVALALASQAMSFDREFLIIAAVILGFDMVIGLTTYGRILGANQDDLRAVHGMSRIRHAYTEVAPIVSRYFTTGTHDDLPGIMMSYGSPPSSGLGIVLYGLTTSGGMIGLIVSLVGGVLAGVVGLLFNASVEWALGIGIVGTILVWLVVTRSTTGYYARHAKELDILFPTPPDDDAAV